MLKRIFHIFTLTALVVGTIAAPSVFAKEAAPAAAVTVSNLDALQTQVNSLAGKLNPQFTMLTQMMFGSIPAFGIDGTKPAGIIANLQGDAYGTAAFLPVKSQKMFDLQVKSMKDAEKIPEGMEFAAKDGYEIVLNNMKWDAEIPTFDAAKLLTVKLNPEALIPFVIQNNATEMDEEQVAKMQDSLKQIDSIEFTLDAAENSDMTLNFAVTPKAGTKAAGNFANTSKLSKTLLSSFCDDKAPLSGQFLGTFDENNRKDFVAALTNNEVIKEDLRNTILTAMDVQKIDVAFSFYADEKGIYGFYAMGISNGDQINDAIVKSFEDAKAEGNDDVQMTANVGKFGKGITVHEIKTEEFDVAIGVHAKYLFAAVTANGTSAVTALKNAFKERPLKSGTVAQNGKLHFSMALLKPFFPQVEDEFVGEVNYSASYTPEKMSGKVFIESALFETIGKIIATFQSENSDDVFGEVGDDDDDVEIEAVEVEADDDDAAEVEADDDDADDAPVSKPAVKTKK